MGAVRHTCRRRVGPNHSPRSLRTPTPSTASFYSPLVTDALFSGAPTVAMVVVWLLTIVAAALVLNTVSNLESPTVCVDSFTTQASENGAELCKSSWFGFEFDSTLGFPGEGPSSEEMGNETWLFRVAEEQRLIEALPVVLGSVKFYYDEADPNLNKVEVTVGCCWLSGKLKRVKDNCTKDGKKPSHLEALVSLREKLEREHCGADHEHHPRAVERAAVWRAEPDAAMPEAATAFDAMRLAASRQSIAEKVAVNAEQAAAEARTTEAAAIAAREAAESEAKEARAAAEALKLAKPSHKKQKTGAFEATASVSLTACCLIRQSTMWPRLCSP